MHHLTLTHVCACPCVAVPWHILAPLWSPDRTPPAVPMKMIGAGHHALKMLVAVTVRIADHQAYTGGSGSRGCPGVPAKLTSVNQCESVSNSVLDCGLCQYV